MLREVELTTSQETYIYREENKIGEGGFGSVYYGQEVKRGFPVAIKRPHFFSDDALERFKNKDCRYLPQLQHDNIVKVFAILTEVKNDRGIVGPPALIMEYIAGENLQQAYEQIKALPFEQKLILFRKICKAIDYAHEQGIVHRDLKPGNVLITVSNEPKIIDFGLAASLKPEELLKITRSNQFMGSLLYMAPEQQNAKNADKTSDIYSLGLLLFFIFTGKHARELLLKGEYSLPEVFEKYLPQEIATVCKKTCQLHKNKRPKNLHSVIAELDMLIVKQGNYTSIHHQFSEYKIQYSALLLAGALVGICLQQLLYETIYWNVLWISIGGFLGILFGLYHWNKFTVDYGKCYSLLGSVALGAIVACYASLSILWNYVLLLIIFPTLLLWSYLLYTTIGNRGYDYSYRKNKVC